MKLKRTISILLSALMMCGTTALSANASEMTIVASVVSQQENVDIFQNYVDEQMKKNDISGVVMVTRGGKVVCQSAQGIANYKDDTAINIDTKFPIGSASKQFCAAAILLLQEEGKLSVNDKLEKYFPEYTIGKNVTVKHLLTMRSGIRDDVNPDIHYPEQVYPMDGYEISEEFTPEENRQAVKDWLFTQKLKFVPGRDWAYSNSNYLLLSEIVEQVSGMSYPQFLKQNIFEPLEMTNTCFIEDFNSLTNIAQNQYEWGYPLEADVKGFAQGAGDLISNTADLDKWLTSFKDASILSEESIAEMTKSYSSSPKYGYGVNLTGDGGVYHAGDISTYNSAVLTYPEEGLNVITITNNRDPYGELRMENVALDIAQYILMHDELGDLDKDGEISVKDVTTLQLHLAKLAPLSDAKLNFADTDGDGEVSVKDVTEIQLYLAKLIPAMRGEAE